MSRNIFQVYTDNPITTNASTDLMYFGQSPYGIGDDAGMLFSDFSAQFAASVGLANSVLGRSANTNGTLADIQAMQEYQILRRFSNTLEFGSIDLSQNNAVGMSILNIDNGGTNSTSTDFTLDGVVVYNGTKLINYASVTAVNNQFNVIADNPGGSQVIIADQKDNLNPSSLAVLRARVGGPASGDPYARFTVLGTTDWSVGLDNSDSDAFVISNNANIGSNNALRIANSTGVITVPSLSANSIVFTDANKNLVSSGGSTGVLPIANGGTNASSQVTNGVNYFNGTSITSADSFTWSSNNLSLNNGASPSGSALITLVEQDVTFQAGIIYRNNSVASNIWFTGLGPEVTGFEYVIKNLFNSTLPFYIDINNNFVLTSGSHTLTSATSTTQSLTSTTLTGSANFALNRISRGDKANGLSGIQYETATTGQWITGMFSTTSAITSNADDFIFRSFNGGGHTVLALGQTTYDVTIPEGNLIVNGSSSKNIQLVNSNVGGNQTIFADNTATSNSASNAIFNARVGGTSAGDPYTLYTVTGAATPSWATGIDNSDSQSYVISSSTTLGTNNNLKITTAGAVSIPRGDLTISRAFANNVNVQILNTTNSSSAGARLNLTAGGTSAGDPFIYFNVTGAQDWALGLDNSDSDAFVLSASATIGTTNCFKVDATGDVTIPAGNLLLTNASKTIQIAGLTASSLVATDGSKNLTSSTSSLNPQFSTLGLGNTVNSPSLTSQLNIFSSTQNSIRLVLSGQEYTSAGNTSSDGAAFVLGINRTNNKQLWIADSARLASSSTNPIFRIVIASSTTCGMGCLATDGTTGLPMALNSQGGDVTVGANGSANLLIGTVGAGLRVKEGSNAKQGITTLVAGTAVVNNTSITANSRIFLTPQNSSGTASYVYVSARTASTSFTITSGSALDTRDIAWEIFEPA